MFQARSVELHCSAVHQLDHDTTNSQVCLISGVHSHIECVPIAAVTLEKGFGKGHTHAQHFFGGQNALYSNRSAMKYHIFTFKSSDSVATSLLDVCGALHSKPNTNRCELSSGFEICRRKLKCRATTTTVAWLSDAHTAHALDFLTLSRFAKK